LVQGEKFAMRVSTTTNPTEEGLQILRERLTSQLASAGLLATSTDDSPKTIDVVVQHYYMRHGATRALVGIMAGADYVQSTVRVLDASTGKALSEFIVESKNPTGWGTSRGMLQDHADKVIETFRGGKQ
jgi:hypothetical protein